MKWVGRVLLVLLIASTLFIAKQNNFQTETAYAQTGSTHNLTLNLNDIEIRVVKTDNSSSTTAGSAMIDSKTSAVFFNKVKVTNNSNQDAYFRIMAQLYYGTIPGPCAIAGGSLCTPPNQYRVVGAGQTLVLPDNTFFLPSSMFSFLSGQYPFQTLALQGINKADLMFILTEAGYGSANVTKTQILKWSAVRIKLQNGAGVPVSNKRVGLFKEGESNTQPPPDQWRSGNTNSAGQVAMALLDPLTAPPLPPMAYTTRYQDGPNPQNYIDLPPPVVVSGPDFQDLTFTICDGGTGGQGFLVERAHAAGCQPNLKVDSAGMSVKLKNRDGRIYEATNPSTINLGWDITEIRIGGIKAKNIGNAPATGKLCYDTVIYLVKYENAKYCKEGEGTNVDIQPGESYLLPTRIIAFGGPYNINIEQLRYSLNKSENHGQLNIRLDPQGQIDDSNRFNNDAYFDDRIVWGVIKVTVRGLSENKSGILVKFSPTDDNRTPIRLATTNPDGVAFLAPTESQYWNARTYRVQASLGGKPITLEKTVDFFADWLTSVDLNVRLGVTSISLRPKIEFSSDHSEGYYLMPSSGSVTVTNATTRVPMTKAIKNGVAVFLPDELRPGNYRLDYATATYRDYYDYFKDNPLVYRWPETTRSEEGSVAFSVRDNSANQLKLMLLLGVSCRQFSVSNIAQYCAYESDVGRQYIFDNLFSESQSVILRMQKWPGGWPMLGFKKVIHSPDPNAITTAAFYDSGTGDRIVIHNHSSREQAVTTYHEMFHFFDFKALNGPVMSNNVDYQRSVKLQFTTDTGKRVWDIAVTPLSYGATTGYPSAKLTSDGQIKYQEVFADEKAATCQYRNQVINRLSDIANYWRSKIGGEPPANLISQRDNVLNRLQGKVKDANGTLVTIPLISQWHNYCLNK